MARPVFSMASLQRCTLFYVSMALARHCLGNCHGTAACPWQCHGTVMKAWHCHEGPWHGGAMARVDGMGLRSRFTGQGRHRARSSALGTGWSALVETASSGDLSASHLQSVPLGIYECVQSTSRLGESMYGCPSLYCVRSSSVCHELWSVD